MHLARRLFILVSLLVPVAACGDRGTDDYPDLLPFEELLAEPALAPDGAADPSAVSSDLHGARAALEARAAGVRSAGTGDAALEARARALRERAAALQRADEADATDAATPDQQ